MNEGDEEVLQMIIVERMYVNDPIIGNSIIG